MNATQALSPPREQRIIDASTGAKTVSREASPHIYNLLENLCISRGITMPALQIVETEALNAYASGIREKQSKIAVKRLIKPFVPHMQ